MGEHLDKIPHDVYVKQMKVRAISCSCGSTLADIGHLVFLGVGPHLSDDFDRDQSLHPPPIQACLLNSTHATRLLGLDRLPRRVRYMDHPQRLAELPPAREILG